MVGMGTDDELLCRIVVSRCEIDMVEIKVRLVFFFLLKFSKKFVFLKKKLLAQDVFQGAYKKSLSAFISGDCSGDYKKLLLALIGE